MNLDLGKIRDEIDAVDENIVNELKKCAEQIATTDINMMAIRNMINKE